MSTTPAPYKLAHVVLRTSQLSAMVEWYRTLLVGKVPFQNDFIAFVTYDDEHHRFAFMQMPDLKPETRDIAGLEHIALTYRGASDLFATYERARDLGIKPYWCVNHGATLSFYYRDPDGHNIELQIDTMDTNDAIDTFMTSQAFRDNPIGVDVDPEVLLARLRAGEPEEEVLRYVPIGKRGITADFQPA